MSRTLWAGALLAGALACGPMAQAQQESRPLSVDLAVTYTGERAKIASTSCGCFWLQGGSVNGAITLFRGLGVAANLTGEHSPNIGPGVDLNKLAFMAGPRYTLRTARWTNRFLGAKHGTSVFGEALFGYAHGFNGIFPTSSGVEASANAFSMQIGGGLNVRIARNFGIRALELDYVRTSLPNSASNTQNDLRLNFGVSYHLRVRNRASFSLP
jgi:hypothetical protein